MNVGVRESFRQVEGEAARARQAIGIGDPAQSAGGNSGDAERDAVTLAQLRRAVFKQPDESPIDVAKSQKAEIVIADRRYPITVVCSGLIL